MRVTSLLSPSGVLSNEVTLGVASMVRNPIASRTPPDELVPIGSRVAFQVAADGTAPFEYQWFKNGTEIDGATQATYVIEFAAEGDEGDYSVRVANALTESGVMSNNVSLALDARVSNVVVSRTPPTGAVAAGQRVDFTVSNAGLGPFTYQWYKDGGEIAGATNVSYTLLAVAESDTADYSVRVFNEETPLGVLSAPVELIVGLPVTNVTAAITLPTEQPVTVGERVEITAAAQGTSPLFYQWLKDGVEIGTNSTENSKLVFAAVSLDDIGSYTVRVSNALTPDGEVSNAVSLEVQEP